MYRSYFLIGVTIAVMAGLLVPVLPLQTKASTCTSSASAAGPNRAFFASQSSAVTARHVAPTRDLGCSSGGVAVANQGASCFAANNGQSRVLNGQSGNEQAQNFLALRSSSCSASNQGGGVEAPPK